MNSAYKNCQRSVYSSAETCTQGKVPLPLPSTLGSLCEGSQLPSLQTPLGNGQNTPRSK